MEAFETQDYSYLMNKTEIQSSENLELLKRKERMCVIQEKNSSLLCTKFGDYCSLNGILTLISIVVLRSLTVQPLARKH